MSDKKRKLLLTSVIFCAAAVLIAAGIFSGIIPVSRVPRAAAKQGTAEFHFIDVGQGDAILIRTESACILIDAGPNSSETELREYLKYYRVGSPDIFVITHRDEDHMGAADMVISEFRPRKILIPSSDPDMMQLTALSGESISAEVVPVSAGDEFRVGGLTLSVLSPGKSAGSKISNDTSVVIRAVFGGISVMLQGDAEMTAEEEIMKNIDRDMLHSTVFKVGHHGSDTSSSPEWLDAVSPELAVISCGKNNIYGHPAPSVVSALKKRGAGIFRTDEKGSIVIVTDGIYAKVVTQP